MVGPRLERVKITVIKDTGSCKSVPFFSEEETVLVELSSLRMKYEEYEDVSVNSVYVVWQVLVEKV